MPAELLRIGKLAQNSQVPIETIRYYEARGPIAAVARTEAGFRLFLPKTLLRLDLMRRSQRLGLSREEIGRRLEIRDRDGLPCTVLQAAL